MSQALQIAELKNEIEELRKENLRLQSEKSRTVEKIIEVPRQIIKNYNSNV